MLANVGVTWYTWLEQGRDITVSTEILGSIARALNLERAELRHLYLLAGRSAPEADNSNKKTLENIERVLAAFNHLPGYVADRYWNVLAINPLGGEIFGLEPGNNCLVKFFTDQEYAGKYPLQSKAAHMMVAQFRQRAAAHPSDLAFEVLAAQLSAHSSWFKRTWESHNLAQEPHMDVEFRHPDLGLLVFESVLLAPIDDPDVMLFLYLPTSNTAEIIARFA